MSESGLLNDSDALSSTSDREGASHLDVLDHLAGAPGNHEVYELVWERGKEMKIRVRKKRSEAKE